MKLNYVEHIGIAVAELEPAIEFYEKKLGIKCYRVEEVHDQKVRTAFFQVGQTKLELLESTADDGPIAKFIEKKGEGLHHIAFSVDEIEKHLETALSNGINLIDRNPRKGAEGLDIAFLHPKSTRGVLIEFCEKK